MNFATFYTQAIKDKNKKITKGKNKGQSSMIDKSKDIHLPGPMYYKVPAKSSAPSASTFVARG